MDVEKHGIRFGKMLFTIFECAASRIISAALIVIAEFFSITKGVAHSINQQIMRSVRLARIKTRMGFQGSLFLEGE